MAFGTYGYGTGPFGTGLGDIPEGEDPFILLSAEYVSQNCIRLWFNSEIVVNFQYKNVLNYNILDSEGNTLEVRRVVEPSQLTSFYVMLFIRNQRIGERYTVFVSNLTDRTGNTLSTDRNAVWWIPEKTKLDNSISNLSSLYDTRAVSRVGQILTAISLSDNLIGGAPTDVSFNLLNYPTFDDSLVPELPIYPDDIYDLGSPFGDEEEFYDGGSPESGSTLLDLGGVGGGSPPPSSPDDFYSMGAPDGVEEDNFEGGTPSDGSPLLDLGGVT